VERAGKEALDRKAGCGINNIRLGRGRTLTVEE
jgi:hypothetical protein